MTERLSVLARELMEGVVQIHVEGYVGEEIKAVLNPKKCELSDWSGSGFFVKTNFGEGYIITNAHVLRNAKIIEVMAMTTSEERFRAQLVAMVKGMEPDIALLRLEETEIQRMKQISGKNICYLELDPKPKVNRGQSIRAIGYPLGMVEPNITAGEITNFIAGGKVSGEIYVTDAAINPGNSGGPAISDNGLVLGLNTAIVEGAENVGFITPSSYISIILENMLQKNEPRYAWMGGEFQKNSSALANHLKLPEQTRGVIAIKVEPDGFLDRAGIIPSDVIYEIAGEKFDRHGIVMNESISHHRNIFDVIKLRPIGDAVEIKYVRQGELFSSRAKVLPPPTWPVPSVPLVSDRNFMEVFGLLIQPLSLEIIDAMYLIDRTLGTDLIKLLNLNKKLLIVTNIDRGTAGDRMEWGMGAVFRHVDGKEVGSLEDFQQLLQEALSRGHEKILITCYYGLLGPFSLQDVKDQDLKIWTASEII